MSTESPENNSPELKTSSAEEIKKQFESLHKPRKIKLSNGLVIEVSQPDIFGMIQEGIIPSDLIEFALNMESKYAGNKLKDSKDIPRLLRFMKLVVLHSVIKPKIVDKTPLEAQEDEVPYSYLEPIDKTKIFNEVVSGGKPLEKFRKEQPKPDENAGLGVQKVSKQKTK